MLPDLTTRLKATFAWMRSHQPIVLLGILVIGLFLYGQNEQHGLARAEHRLARVVHEQAVLNYNDCANRRDNSIRFNKLIDRLNHGVSISTTLSAADKKDRMAAYNSIRPHVPECGRKP